MPKSTFGGGVIVKASTLVVGDTIRDPRKRNRVLVVESLGSQIFARGYEQSEMEQHRYFSLDEYVIKVTQASTESSVDV